MYQLNLVLCTVDSNEHGCTVECLYYSHVCTYLDIVFHFLPLTLPAIHTLLLRPSTQDKEDD